jgi:hypothetical protein
VGDGFSLFDLESLNGTFVNGRPVREHALAHGDEISIGDSRIVFLSGDADAPARASNPVELSERGVTALTTVRLKVSDALAPAEGSGVEAQAMSSLARDLTILVKVSTAINSVRGTDALQRELLRFVFEVVPAERGAILLLGEEGEVVSVDDGEAEVQMGALKLRQPLASLERLGRAKRAAGQSSARSAREFAATMESVPVELDLRGKRVEEIPPLIERYLHDAYLMGMPWVRIIHGKGTGALRQVVRDQLRDNPVVSKSEAAGSNEGGEGATVAHLRKN